MDAQTRKWTRAEYERLVDAEILGPEDRIELLGGAMICKEPQYSPHATSILLAERVLTQVFGPGWLVRSQMPVALDRIWRPASRGTTDEILTATPTVTLPRGRDPAETASPSDRAPLATVRASASGRRRQAGRGRRRCTR